jgi:hypothetical protein
MNERIQELLEQATKAVDPENRVWVFSEVDQAKFAELIVRECCDQVRMVDAMEIKKHFGVEE